MSEFTAILNNKDLFQVEVEFRPIVDILNLLNEQIKSLEERTSSLEGISKTHVSYEEYESSNKELVERISPIEERLNSIANQISGLSTDVKNLDSRTNLTINERINDILVSTSMNINHSTNTISAQVRENYEAIKSAKQEVDDFISNQNKLNIESLIDNVKKNARGINDLKKKLSELTSDDFNSSRNNENVNEYESKMKENIESLRKEVNQQKGDINKITSELNETKERLSIIEENILLRTDDGTSINSSKSSFAYSPSKDRNGDDLNQLSAGLSSLKDELNAHETNVVKAMKAIQYELQQIRDNGQGLLSLPSMNLYNVVPSFFNEDKQILSMSDTSPVLELAEKPNEEEEEKKSIVKENRNRDSFERERKKFLRTESILKNKNDFHKTNNTSSSQKASNTNSVVIVPDEPVQNSSIIRTIDIDSIVRRIKSEIDLSDIQKSFQQFKKDHNEIINAIERKVDREYVERLFDKFRIIVHNMNDRVKELASLTDDYATKEDLKLIVQIVKNLPKESRPGTAVKRGPTCLFCGRPKSSIAGEISPRTAAMAGSPPVQNVATKDGDIGCEFVYGDGQAYRRDENFQSFPHLDILPPLPVKENDESKNLNKAGISNTTTETNSRVSFTRNSERIKTSSSMPNSRISKSRK